MSEDMSDGSKKWPRVMAVCGHMAAVNETYMLCGECGHVAWSRVKDGTLKISPDSEVVSLRSENAALRKALDRWGMRVSWNAECERDRKFCPSCKADDMDEFGELQTIVHHEDCSLGQVLAPRPPGTKEKS